MGNCIACTPRFNNNNNNNNNNRNLQRQNQNQDYSLIDALDDLEFERLLGVEDMDLNNPSLNKDIYNKNNQPLLLNNNNIINSRGSTPSLINEEYDDVEQSAFLFEDDDNISILKPINEEDLKRVSKLVDEQIELSKALTIEEDNNPTFDELELDLSNSDFNEFTLKEVLARVQMEENQLEGEEERGKEELLQIQYKVKEEQEQEQEQEQEIANNEEILKMDFKDNQVSEDN